MRRLIATFLLLVGLVGNLGPLALAVVAPPHACCVRKAIHRCHESIASESGPLIIGNATVCSHRCCGAAGTVSWAKTQPPTAAHHAQDVKPHLGQLYSFPPDTTVCRFQSTRAPPQLSVA
jgi:hypothetical protein